MTEGVTILVYCPKIWSLQFALLVLMIKFALIVEHEQVSACDKFGVIQSRNVGEIKNNIRGSKVINAIV